MKTRLRYLFLASALSAVAAISACSSLPDAEPVDIGEVHLRTGGEASRRLAIDKDKALVYGESILPFARISRRAYCDYLRTENAQPEECDKSMPLVKEDGWELLYDSRVALSRDDQQTRLTFLVFYRVHLTDPTRGDIAFGFRGTKPSYGSDWYANLRWVTRFLPGTDQYEVLYANSPALIDKAFKDASALAPTVKHFDVYSTGHSLGGGLAQMFAFSDRRVKAAIVFDPSPVTGYFNVVVDDDRVNCDARVLRVYERGEALQYLRSFMRRLYTPTENVSEVDFDLLQGGFSPLTNHSIATFTEKLQKGLDALEKQTSQQPLDRTQRRLALATLLPDNADGTCHKERFKPAKPTQPATDQIKLSATTR